ncbi:MAG: hypothetical protein LBK82_11635, partial [Planctomycetaceae bacterium]|nr:hypothetical protein [Planctomycetaceae bacterium]
MKTKKLWKYAVATAVLFATLPMCTFAQTGVTVSEKITSQQLTTIYDPNDAAAGVEIKITGVDAGNVLYKSGSTAQNKPFVAGAGTIQLNGVDVTKATTPTSPWGGPSVGVLINNSAMTPLSNKTINTGDINIAGEVSDGYLVGFLYHSDYDYDYNSGTYNDQAFDGTLTIGNVNVENVTDTEFTYTSAYGVEFDTAITGKVTVGNIKATADGAYSSADGFSSYGLTDGATVTLGNVDVTAQYAYGVDVGDIGDSDKTTTEKFTVGNINVTSKDGYGTGVYVDIQEDGVFEAKDITVKGTNDYGVEGVSAYSIAKGGTFNVGKVQVEGDSYATGIAIYDSGTFTVTNDVVAKTNAAKDSYVTVTGIDTGGWGYGGNSNLTIDTKDGDVQISGIAKNSGNTAQSINMNSDNDTLTVTGANKHANKGQAFDVSGAENVRWETDAEYTKSSFTTSADTVHQVATGKNVGTNGGVNTDGNKYTVGNAADNKSAGTLAISTLNAGDVVVNNGILAIDGSKTSNINSLTIGNNNKDGQASAAVALYGNVASGQVAGLTINSGTVTTFDNAVKDPTTKAEILSLSTITEYVKKGNNYVAKNREKASLADGFLLPASIHRYNTGWEATRDHLISGGQTSCKPCESVCNPCDPCNKSDGFSLGCSAWVNYVGRSNSYRSSYSNIGINNGDWEIGTDGIQVGLDLYKSSKAQLGLLFGYEG